MLRRTLASRGNWQKQRQTQTAQWASDIEEKPMSLIDPSYGWRRGVLPRFHAPTQFHRQLMMRRMLTELIRRDHVIVAGARAPALRIVADHAVKLAKKGDTDSRQEMAHFLTDPLMVDKAFDELPRRFEDHHGSYCMVTKLGTARRRDNMAMWFVEFKNRDMSDCHKGEDYTKGPERFFLPPKVIETERGVVRPPHMQLAFDRWASRFKTEEFHHWWKMRHSKLRYWGVRNVPHPADVDPLWSEKDEEEWHNEILQSSSAEAFDLDAEDDEEVSRAEMAQAQAEQRAAAEEVKHPDYESPMKH